MGGMLSMCWIGLTGMQHVRWLVVNAVVRTRDEICGVVARGGYNQVGF
jgi:hypothetical protein